MTPIGALARLAPAVLAGGLLALPAFPASAQTPTGGPAGPAGAVEPAVACEWADTSDFDFDSFDADYYLSLDADGHANLRVVETLVAVFPLCDQNRGIIRAIPDQARGYPLEQRMLSITDENGDAVYWERYDESEYDSSTGRYVPFVEYWLGTDEFVHGRTTYVLEYTMQSAITHVTDVPVAGGIDEFYWDINGDGWGQTFNQVAARIHLAPELRNALEGHTACYVGEFGSAGGCELRQTEDGYAVTVSPVYPYSTVTVSIAFDGGTVVQRIRPQESWVVQVAPKAIFGLIAALIVVGVVIRATVWRGPRRGLIIAQYEPPGQDILLSAEVLGRAHRGLSALLIDFAVRGIIRIVDSQPGSTDPKLPNRFELELLDSSLATPRELKVLTTMFGKEAKPGKKVNPGTFSAKVGASLYGLTADTARYATSEGYRKLPGDRLPKIMRRIAGLSLLLFIPIWVYAFWNDIPDAGPIHLFMWLSFAGFILLAIVLVRPTMLTEKGAPLRDHLLGMREYLTVAEEERLRVLQSPQGAQRRIDPADRDAIVHLYERLLPYAVLWGVEREWARQLQVHYQDASPTWLVGDTISANFISSFSTSAMTRVHPIVTSSSGGSGGSSWSSSGSSSFSSGSFGGGFSGGGGGGGGGGGR